MLLNAMAKAHRGVLAHFL